MSKRYTDAEKIAYYKAKAQGASKPTYSKKSYPVKKTYTKKSYAKKPSYNKAVKPALEFGGSMIGSAIGSLVGPEGIPIGAMLGQQAGASIASIGGYGRYKSKRILLCNKNPCNG